MAASERMLFKFFKALALPGVTVLQTHFKITQVQFELRLLKHFLESTTEDIYNHRESVHQLQESTYYLLGAGTYNLHQVSTSGISFDCQ